MMYEATVVVCAEIQNIQSKASTMYNFWMLNLAVRKETAWL